MKRKILLLTHCDPTAEKVGGHLRVANVVKALEKIAEVKTVFVDHDSNEKESESVRRRLAEKGIDVARVRLLPPKSFASKIQRYANPRYTELHGCVVDEEDRKRILAELPEFDMVWIHHVRTANVFKLWHWPKSVLDIDDIQSCYQRSVWESAPSGIERLKAGLQIMIERRREHLLNERFSVLSVCSRTDREYLSDLKSVMIIPNGFERPAEEPKPDPITPARIGFIGPLSFQANLDGLSWFVKDSWPIIKKAAPDTRLRIIGKGSAGELKPNGADIDGLGWVSDPAAEMATWSAMIVPINLGAGTRVKIAEAFSRKCPVVATRLGAYGYDVTHGRELLLADRGEEFAQACISLIQDQKKGAQLAENAWKLFLSQLTWDTIAPRIQATAEKCMSCS